MVNELQIKYQLSNQKGTIRLQYVLQSYIKVVQTYNNHQKNKKLSTSEIKYLSLSDSTHDEIVEEMIRRDQLYYDK